MSVANRRFLETRAHQREWMDAPDIEEAKLLGALDGLRRVNLFTRGPGIVWPYLRHWASKRNGESFRVLDAACGGGDTTVALAKRFRRAGMNVHVDGCDMNEASISYASERAARAGVDATFFRCDVVNDPLPQGYDVVVCSLFLHHLAREEALHYLQRASEVSKRGVLVQDLVRSRAGWWLAYLGVRVLLCNAVCREDGPLSVECAFTPDEARDLACEAGLSGAFVENRFPWRFVLAWEKTP